MRHRRSLQYLIGVLALSLVAAACSSSDTGSVGGAVRSEREIVTVQPDLGMPPLNVNVLLTDEGFEPDFIFLPAGRQIRLVLRNRGTTEHHFRIKGLVPAQLRWMLTPEVDETEVDDLSPEEMADLGIVLEGGEGEADLSHIVHHLTPQFVPTKEVSPTGIKPLGTDVHGYATLGTTEVMTFFALQTGEFVSEDVRFPDITGRVIVFAADQN